MKSLLLTSVATALLTLAPVYAANAAEPAAPQKAAIGDWGVDTKGLSKTVKPGNDFYRYVTGQCHFRERASTQQAVAAHDREI